MDTCLPLVYVHTTNSVEYSYQFLALSLPPSLALVVIQFKPTTGEIIL